MDCISSVGRGTWSLNGTWHWNQPAGCEFGNNVTHDAVQGFLVNRSLLFLGNSIIRRHMYSMIDSLFGLKKTKRFEAPGDKIYDWHNHHNIVVLVNLDTRQHYKLSLGQLCRASLSTYVPLHGSHVLVNRQTVAAVTKLRTRRRPNATTLGKAMRSFGQIVRITQENSHLYSLLAEIDLKAITYRWSNHSRPDRLAFHTQTHPFEKDQLWRVVPLDSVYDPRSLKCGKRSSYEEAIAAVLKKHNMDRWTVFAYAFSWMNTEDHQIFSLCRNWDEYTIGANADYVLSMGHSSAFSKTLARLRATHACFRNRDGSRSSWLTRLPYHLAGKRVSQNVSQRIFEVDIGDPLMRGQKYANFRWLEAARIHQLDKGRAFMNLLLLNALRNIPK